MEDSKADFLKNHFIENLKKINPTTKPVFGKMNVHQMIEHMNMAFQQASGLLPVSALHDDEMTAKLYRFMMSEVPFKDNTPNSLLPDEPSNPIHSTINYSILELKNSIDLFFKTYENNSEKRNLNPFFGNLNDVEWTQLLHKHAQHHLRQFNQL